MRAETVEEILADPEVDVIVNLTVPAAHYDVSRRILEAGKHAYSEKPLVLTLEEGEKLRASPRPRACAWARRPTPSWAAPTSRRARRSTTARSAAIIGGTAHVMSHGMEHWHPNPDFFFPPGGGPILDIGPYYITDLVNLIGPVKAVAGIANASYPQPDHRQRAAPRARRSRSRRRRTSTPSSSSPAARR